MGRKMKQGGGGWGEVDRARRSRRASLLGGGDGGGRCLLSESFNGEGEALRLRAQPRQWP